MEYKIIYSFCVAEEIEKGETVYCLDRQEKVVFNINDTSYERALRMLLDAKSNDRYEFWKEIRKDA